MQPSVSYLTMDIEDYPPYQELLKSRTLLYGPEPRRVVRCVCGTYPLDNSCACAGEPRSRDDFCDKEDYDTFCARQYEEHMWAMVYNEWLSQVLEYDAMWHEQTKQIRKEFRDLQDAESSIGCADCQLAGYSTCYCKCPMCNIKYCNGECMTQQHEYHEKKCYCGSHYCDGECGVLWCGCIDVCRKRKHKRGF